MSFFIVNNLFFALVKKLSKPAFIKIKYFQFLVIKSIIKSCGGFFSNSNCRLTYTSTNEYKEYLDNCDQEIIKDNIQRGNEILEHKFDLLGINNISWGSEIPWHSDLATNHVWNNLFYEKMVPVSTVDDDHDKKIPWELSRLQYLFILYKTYLITHQKIYLNKIINILEGWIGDNPPFYGVNWQNSMEVGIRAANIILIVSYLQKLLPAALLSKVNQILLYHFLYILINPEISLNRKLQRKRKQKITHIHRNNHFLFNIIGLIFLTLYFKSHSWLKFVRDKSISLLFSEIGFQILDDGVDFEGSIGYHGYVLESVLFIFILLKKLAIDIPENYSNKLHKMLYFTLYYTKPDGTFPIIGDYDSGRLFTLGKSVHNSHLNLLATGALFFDSDEFKTELSEFSEEVFWLFGMEGKSTFEKLPCNRRSISSKAFESSGFYIMRNASDYMIISTGNSINHGSGGHYHNDCFGFELYANDKSFIVDPGCYTYASKKWRNLFRSSQYHNTIVVDDEEINRFDGDSMFFLENDARPEVLEWKVDNDCDVFVGRHYGYCRLSDPVIVTRRIEFHKKEGCWKISDKLSGSGQHKVEWYFHLSPLKICIREDNPLSVYTDERGTNLQIMPLNQAEKLTIKVEDGWISSAYGEKIQAPIVSYVSNIDLRDSEIEFSFIIEPI